MHLRFEGVNLWLLSDHFQNLSCDGDRRHDEPVVKVVDGSVSDIGTEHLVDDENVASR